MTFCNDYPLCELVCASPRQVERLCIAVAEWNFYGIDIGCSLYKIAGRKNLNASLCNRLDDSVERVLFIVPKVIITQADALFRAACGSPERQPRRGRAKNTPLYHPDGVVALAQRAKQGVEMYAEIMLK